MARGILVELLSRPDGWETTCDDMWALSRARHGDASPGRRLFRAAFAELKERGYMHSKQEPLAGGKYGTVLTVYDLPAQTDVPASGTSDEQAPDEDDETAGGTDVPDAGTSDEEAPEQAEEAAGRTDVPHAGTSESTDVPHGGTSVRPAETDVPAGRADVPPTDVPHAGTSLERRSTKTEEKTVGPGRRPTTGSSGELRGRLRRAGTSPSRRSRSCSDRLRDRTHAAAPPGSTPVPRAPRRDGRDRDRAATGNHHRTARGSHRPTVE